MKMILQFTLLLLIGSQALAETVALSGPQIQAAPGASFDAPFTLQAAPALGALQLDVLYDAARLDELTVEPAVMLTTAQGGLEFHLVEPGRLRLALACSKPIDGDGPIFRLLGKLKTSGDSQSVALKIDAAQAWQSKTLRELRVVPTDGMITPGSVGLDFKSLPFWVWIVGGIGLAILLLLIVIACKMKSK